MDVKTLITILAAISGIILGWVGGTRAFKQDIAQDAGNGAALKTDVEYIKRGVDDMRLEQRAQGQRFDVLSERVTRIEESAKSYHKRLDRFEENRRSDV
ncbi:hypothetical protein [Paenibacillus riograndensis]|uniref:Uncharacterized protein n=2 Tax=Paenibacillus riograndensis TaxID=483937 RepID=A0A0E4H9M4_9BACL|nr:hypothetical protein [Paenibacillus riograndensis]CQR55246.1 hypothetical protein PRIO_2842 [Paenibacillus riograndensis SBR5]